MIVTAPGRKTVATSRVNNTFPAGEPEPREPYATRVQDRSVPMVVDHGDRRGVEQQAWEVDEVPDLREFSQCGATSHTLRPRVRHDPTHTIGAGIGLVGVDERGSVSSGALEKGEGPRRATGQWHDQQRGQLLALVREAVHQSGSAGRTASPGLR